MSESTGLVLGEVERQGSRLDPDIFTSMVKAVESFVQHVSTRMLAEIRPPPGG